VWREDATNVRSVCEREGIALGTIDAVVSSLPFLLMPDGIRGRILHETAAVLRPGGRFVMLTYRPEKFFPSVRRFRAQMQAEFTSVRMARFVPLNFPPAFVYRCER
jgi:phospholipid N-methyltransferase